MKKISILIVSLLVVLIAVPVAHADKEVSIGGKIYAHWYYDLSDTLNYSMSNVNFENYSTFGISRAYLIGKAKLSDKTSGMITIDVNPDELSSAGGVNYMRLKYAYLKWKFYSGLNFGMAAKFGLQETGWNHEMEKIWGRRYIAKVPADHFGMETTSDNGLTFIGTLGEKGKWGWASLSAYNGATYASQWDNNPTKDINFVAFIKPLNANPDFANSSVGLQYYLGTLNAYNDSSDVKDDYKKTLISLEANVQYRKVFSLGLEYDAYKSPVILDTGGFWPDTSDNKANIISLFGTLWFEQLAENSKMFQTLNLFFRYQMYDPDADDHDLGGGVTNEWKYNEFIIGAECTPVDGFAASLNFRSETTKDRGPGLDDISNSYLFLNTLFEF